MSCELGSRIYHCAQLSKKYKVFFAPECIEKGLNYKQKIAQVINTASIVILLVDKNYFDNCEKEDDIVLFELKTALARQDIQFLPIFINNASLAGLNSIKDFTSGDIERIMHINGLNYTGIYDFSVENDLLPRIDSIIDGGNEVEKHSQRKKGRYYGATAKNELEFLKIQQQFLYDYDDDVYQKLLKDKSGLTVLDIGCNDGTQTINRFSTDSRITKIVGIDIDPTAISIASANYPQGIFAVMDVEAEDFKRSMQKLMADNNIEKFDLISISMVILHLERPYKFLNQVKSFLAKNGALFIRDIDDGLNLAYPDDGIFKRLIEICKYCDILGYRQSGRQIYSYLKNANFSNVRLEKIGLNTSGMDYDEREILFEIYFGYIPIALQKTMERNKNIILRAQLDYEWVTEVLETARELFMKNDFIFSLGYFIYTAEA